MFLSEHRAAAISDPSSPIDERAVLIVDRAVRNDDRSALIDDHFSVIDDRGMGNVGRILANDARGVLMRKRFSRIDDPGKVIGSAATASMHPAGSLARDQVPMA